MESAPLTYSASAQRAYGRLRIAFNRRGAETVLAVLRQEGCFKARLPRPEPGGIPEAVLLNTSGGITGGDDLAARIEAGAGAHFVVTTQAAERYYRASTASPPATVRSDLAVAEGALLEWLPQETILFDRCRVDRSLSVDLEPGARFLGVESLIFGRQAMGETVREISLIDRIIIRRAGKPILHDATRLEGEVATLMGRASTFADARAMATVVFVTPGAEGFVEPLRTALGPGLLPDHSLEAGVSAWNGLVLARILARNGAELRRAVLSALDILRGGAALPRVWQL
jgi:urease accessory protein